ncbi:MAG TPA: sodium:solute symporter family protein [Ruminococcaceae bacterium]|nr:sodium:solute symporter family protein [Oscillospiraceae bacterium]
MPKEWIMVIVIALYVVLMLVAGLISSKSSKSMAGFTVGGRSAGAWISALSYGTAYFSAVMFIGYSGTSGWRFGLWAILIGIGNAVFGTWLAWKVLARRTRDVSHRHHLKSMPQFFMARYGSGRMKTFSAVVILIFLIPYSASVYKGLTSVCSVLLNVDPAVCMIVIAVIAALLLVLGGYLATLKADFIQGIIMFFGVALLIVFLLRSPAVADGGGFSGMWDFMRENGMAPLSGGDTVALLATILMTSFGTWGLPQMIHKYYGIKDDNEAKRGTVISVIFALLVAGGGYLIGSFSHLFFGKELPDGGVDYVVPHMLNMSALPVLLLGIVLVLLVSASVSTLSSITLTACSTATMDLVKGRTRKELTSKGSTVLTKVLCIFFVIASYFIANSNTPILDMMSYSWGIISGSFLAPYVIALYWKGVNKIGAWAGILGGFFLALIPAVSKILTLLPFVSDSSGTLQKLASYGPQFAVGAMLLSMLLCFTVSLIAKSRGFDGSKVAKSFYEGSVEKNAKTV